MRKVKPTIPKAKISRINIRGLILPKNFWKERGLCKYRIPENDIIPRDKMKNKTY
jgi:hypothetical protein